MSIERQILFSLLRNALWGTPVGDLPEDFSWEDLVADASRQTVLGLVCDAVRSMPQDRLPQDEILKRLRAFRVQSVRTHAMLNSRLAELLEIFRSEGIEPVLFKGQGLAANYPDPSARQCGDIDLYVGAENYERACEAGIKHFGRHKHDSESIKHYHLQYKEVQVELHRIAETLPGRRRNKLYQQWTIKHLHSPALRSLRIAEAEVTLPPYQFDCVYVLNHLWHHFINGGVGLRQLCDWTMYLHRYHDKIDAAVLTRDLKAFGLSQVWELFSDIAVRYLGLPAGDCPLYSGKSSSRSEAVLDLIFSEGNFGKYSERRTSRRPQGYSAGKLHSFKITGKRYLGLFRLFPLEALSCFVRFVSHGVYHYFKGLK